jgi:peroxiredoxin Q/BCP
MKSIQVGDMIPDFSLPDQDGNMFNVDSVRGKKKLVIFFYPLD